MSITATELKANLSKSLPVLLQSKLLISTTWSVKTFKGQEHADNLAEQIIGKLLSFVELTDTRAVDCQTAIGINNNDFEDAILIAGAARESMDYIVTRNTEHFSVSPVPAFSPADFIKILSNGNKG